ncbi:MAG: hydantoinase B/oxoprolinase family protein, partial [Planctomycetaceae bacterium]
DALPIYSGRRLEVVVARVQVTGRMPDVPSPQSDVIPRKIQATRQTDAYFNGAGVKTGVFRREQLCPGDSFTGPAIVSEPASTVVIDPGFQASILAGGEILIQESSDSNVRFSQTVEGLPQRDNHSSADPVLLEIFNNLFASIAEQMGVTLQKTSLSTNVKERLDFSCAIFTPAGDLVVNAPHIPVHLGAMSETVRHLLSDEPDIRPGDVFITNDPFRGGSHLPDVTVITPVHDPDSGQLMFFTASRAHHSEIGGIVPGSMPPFSKNLAEEGVLIRCFRIVEEGCAREDKLRKLLAFGPAGSRSIENNLADISAQIAANNCGAKLLAQLVERYSLPRVHDYMAFIQRAAAEKMRMALRSFPDGTYESIDYLDDGSPIQAVITIDDDMARVDFTGTGPVLTESNLNANRAIVTAAVLYVFRCLIVEDIPLNAGVLEPVSILLPECLLNPPARDNPAECVAVVGGNVETSQRVVDVLLAALGVAAGSQGTMNNLTFGDSSFGYYETLCGGSGATPDASGADAVHT